MSELREQVRDRYAAAARAVGEGYAANDWDQEAGCCEPQQGLGALLYDGTQRSELPDEAVLASLGCGNPTALASMNEGEAVLDLGSGGGIDVLLSARAGRPHGEGVRPGYDRRDARPRSGERARKQVPRTSSS